MSHWILVPVVLPALVGALMALGLRLPLALHRALSLAACIGLLAVAPALIVATSGRL